MHTFWFCNYNHDNKHLMNAQVKIPLKEVVETKCAGEGMKGKRQGEHGGTRGGACNLKARWYVHDEKTMKTFRLEKDNRVDWELAVNDE